MQRMDYGIVQEPGATRTKKEVRVLLSKLKWCSKTRNLNKGRQLHIEAVETRSDSCIYVATALVRMYARCGSMAEARQVFDEMEQPDVVSWTALITGYANNGEGVTALNLFETMKSQGCAPDSFTFVAAIKACVSMALELNGSERALQCARQIHLEIGVHSDVYVQSSLIDMYAKFGNMVEARRVFDNMKYQDVVSWTTLIMGYAVNGEGHIALDLFERMKFQGYMPDRVTLIAALKACTSLAQSQDASCRAECLARGKEIHSEFCSDSDIHVKSTLIDMYSKCGSMVDARQVFDALAEPNVVAWNALILGYSENGEGILALDLFERIKTVETCVPDSFTYVAALKACTSFAQESKADALEKGRQVHSEIGCSVDLYMQNTLIDMYSKCGSMNDARQVFDSIKHPDVVSWTALILGYAENGESVTALNMFARMKFHGCTPNTVTFVAALKASGSLGALESGRKIHAEMNTGTGNSVNVLVDFYARSGSLVEAQKLFDTHPETRDVSTWTSLLAGYSRLGDSELVFELFEGMQDAGIQPNGVTLLCVLSCCSHAGLVEQATEVFEEMSSKYDNAPSAEHYNCMVDLLSRSSKLDEAMALVRSMPFRQDLLSWMTLLGACRKWKNVGMGRLAFACIVSLDNSNAAAYVVMAEIYKSKRMSKEQEIVLGMRKKLSIPPKEQEQQTCWSAEDDEVHCFSSSEIN